MEAPNPNHQTPGKLQYPSIKGNLVRFLVWTLELGDSLVLSAFESACVPA